MLIRRRESEMMDDPRLPAGEHRRALAGLARINVLSNAAGAVWRGVREVLESGGVRGAGDREAGAINGAAAEVSLMDVACGSGDVAVGVAQRAAVWLGARGGDGGGRPTVHLVDISGEALSAAAERAGAAGVRAVAHRVDVCAGALPAEDGGVDVAMSSLFLHHLDRGDVVRLLREMGRVARRGVVVNDLERCRRGVFAARVASRLLTGSRVVRVDSVRSVRSAWTVEELGEMAREAGLVGARVERVFPLRMTLIWKRPPP